MTAKDYILTPKNRICRALGVKSLRGHAENAEGLTGGGTCLLKYSGIGERPRIVLDLGPASPGGYPVFAIKSHSGNPVLRLSYSDWYPYIMDEKHGDNGDFIRGCCKYLGVELPVLPGNPNRFELYTIRRNGRFLFPLIQGQQRFAAITLDTPGQVEIEDFYIYYTSDTGKYDGSFFADDDGLNRLWYSSTYTVQLASIDNSRSWERLDGALLIRALTKGNPAGIINEGLAWNDYNFTFKAQISVNPHCSSGIGWLVRAKGLDDAYAFSLTLDGSFKFSIRENGVNRLVREKKLPVTVYDNFSYTITTAVAGNELEVFLDGQRIFSEACEKYSAGTAGFIQAQEHWAFVEEISVKQGQTELFYDDFSEDSGDKYLFASSEPFLADGAKRDRLPWSGDLDWIGRNAYYAFRETRYMRGSLRMFARHQTPEGYIWGTCYPENTVPPKIGEYGYYESDIFSAWFVPAAADYFLFSGDRELISEIYESILRDLEYLWQFVEGNGLFFQRYETSKGLWDHELNDIGFYSYNNIIIYDAFAEGAFIARETGDLRNAEMLFERAETLKKGILALLWNEKRGCFPKGLGKPEYCHMANCLALAVEILTPAEARRAAESLVNWFADNSVFGKMVTLFIRGCYNYGFDDLAYNTLTGKTGIAIDAEGNPIQVNWIDSITDERGPATTTECMLYPPVANPGGKAWGDMSHPDTGVAHLISGYILGVQPVLPGYKEFITAPHPCGLTKVLGDVPTPYGDIVLSWEMREDTFILELNHPQEIIPHFDFRNVKYKNIFITVNGKQIQASSNERLSGGDVNETKYAIS